MSKLNVTTIIDKEVIFNNKIEDSLESLQKIVGGYIECPSVSKLLMKCGIDMYINDSGAIDGLPVSAVIINDNIDVIDCIHGNIIFAGHDEYGNTTSLNDKQIKFLESFLCMSFPLTSGEFVYVIPS